MCIRDRNNLLPPPEKKKYSKDHLLILTFIYYYKNILSINDIQTLLAPLKEMYFKKDRTPDLGTIYERIFNMEISQSEPILDDIQTKLNAAKDIFPDTEGDEKELLTFFSFICLLSYDIYIKKQLVEKLIDQMSENAEASDTKEKNKTHKK